MYLERDAMFGSIDEQFTRVALVARQPSHQRPAPGWAGRKYRVSSLRHDPTANRTMSSSFGGACPTYSTMDVVVIRTHMIETMVF